MEPYSRLGSPAKESTVAKPSNGAGIHSIARLTLAALAAVSMLGACGGGGDDRQPFGTSTPVFASAPAAATPPRDCTPVAPVTSQEVPPTVTAVVGGLLTDALGPQWLIFAARSDGSARAFYGADVATVARPSAYIAAAGPWHRGGDLNWHNGYDWGVGDAACLEVTYDTALPSLTGTLRRRSGISGSISGGSIPGSTYSFEQPADHDAVVGAWMLGGNTAITVSAAGEFTGRHMDCPYQAVLSPAVDGKNWFRFSLTFDAGCAIVESTGIGGLAGLAIAFSIGGAQRLLLYADGNNGWDELQFHSLGVRSGP